MPERESAPGGAKSGAEQTEATGKSERAVRRVRRRPLDDFDRLGREVADVLRSAERAAQLTREKAEEWVAERHAAVDAEMSARYEEAAALDARVRTKLELAEVRLAEADRRLHEADVLREEAESDAASRRDQVERELEGLRREAQDAIADAREAATAIRQGAERQAADILRGALEERQRRIEQLRVEEEQIGEEIEALLAGMGANAIDDGTSHPDRPGPGLDADEHDLAEPEPVGLDEEAGLNPRETIDLRAPEADVPPAAGDRERDVSGSGRAMPGKPSVLVEASNRTAARARLKLVDEGLAESAVADIVQTAIRRAIGRSFLAGDPEVGPEGVLDPGGAVEADEPDPAS